MAPVDQPMAPPRADIAVGRRESLVALGALDIAELHQARVTRPRLQDGGALKLKEGLYAPR